MHLVNKRRIQSVSSAVEICLLFAKLTVTRALYDNFRPKCYCVIIFGEIKHKPFHLFARVLRLLTVTKALYDKVLARLLVNPGDLKHKPFHLLAKLTVIRALKYPALRQDIIDALSCDRWVSCLCFCRPLGGGLTLALRTSDSRSISVGSIMSP